jgi:hypothetical protein
LFQALLATLPHLKEMEESMQQHLEVSFFLAIGKFVKKWD